MKKPATFLAVCAALLSFTVFAQPDTCITELRNPAANCITGLQLGMWYTSADPSEPQDMEFYVDWGDGTDPHTWEIVQTGGYGLYPFHQYTSPGTYYAVVVYSDDNVPVHSDTLEIVVTNTEPCGFTGEFVHQIVNGEWILLPDVPFDFTGADNTTVTIFPDSEYSYGGLDLDNAPYVVRINPGWLTLNNLVQVDTNTVIPDFNAGYYQANNPSASETNWTVTCPGTGGGDPDFSLSYVMATNFIAPLQTGELLGSVCTLGCADTGIVTVAITVPAGYMPDLGGLTNAAFDGTHLTFDVAGLPSCTDFAVDFTFPGNTPSGTLACFDIALVSPNDPDQLNNTTEACAVILNSFDPNMKWVNRGPNIDASSREQLCYAVHFQNEGNMAALNITVRDTLSEYLDLSTLRLVGATHPVILQVDPVSREVRFVFEDIQLAPASQDEEASKGHVVYTIEENDGLAAWTEIRNTAAIYFDFNPPVITNTVSNVNALVGLDEQALSALSVYPNPAGGTVRFSEAVSAIRVLDVSGRIVEETVVFNNAYAVSGLKDGVYQLQLATAKGVQFRKLVVQH